jgi:uncharacterized protein
MKPELVDRYERLKARGLSEEQDRRMHEEMASVNTAHFLPDDDDRAPPLRGRPASVYGYHDLQDLQHLPAVRTCLANQLRSIDELLERDRLREKDGFPRKIRVGRLIKPGKGGKDKVVVVPTTVEEKLIHDNAFKESSQDSPDGGSGDGEEGEVIGEEPVRPQQGSGTGPGQGEGGPHEMESSAYDLGKILTEKFELPNLKEKGKKRSLTRYVYDMTDRHRGFGQFLDKKATLRKILETNIHLGNVTDIDDVDLASFLIAPADRIYRILSREKDYESQAMVFFLRDYSGSMSGKPTELVVAQHVMIYSWLLYQYEKQVESRFILHDTEAKEVPDFYTYYNSQVAGGTMVASAFKLVNEIVLNENLAQDYNIYVFHGTDGDDWDIDGKEAIPAITRMLTYASRVGITIAEHGTSTSGATEVERYLKKSDVLNTKANLIRLDTMNKDADEPRLIEGIKRLIS